MSLTVEQLRELSTKLASDPDMVYELEPEQTAELRRYLNPLSNVVTTKKRYASMGLVNWKEKYLRRLHMTALVGYIYRMLEEYDAEEEIEAEKRRYQREVDNINTNVPTSDPTSVQTSDQVSKLAAARSAHERRMELIKPHCQAIIRRFLNRNFNFNPDMHLRGSHSENPADPERKPREDAIREACAVASRAPDIDAKLATKTDDVYKYMRSGLLTAYQSATAAAGTIKSALGTMMDPNISPADCQGILLKKYVELNDLIVDLRKITDPLANADTLAAWKVDPPVDVFHQFDRYLVNHYEQLRDVVQALYNEKSDFEYAVIFYDAFKTAEAAREFHVQHESEFRFEVHTIENNGITLIGPFKENRSRVDFYNKNTEIMKRMMDQITADHKLGADLMKKVVKAKKKKNIEEAGPDNPKLLQYARTMNIVQELGARKVLTQEEQEKLYEAKKLAQSLREDYEVPDDAIQVDMFYPTEDGLAKTKFYTQAEAPLHMQEGSQYVDKYQPKRSKKLDSAYKTKVVTSRDGRKMEIKVPVHEEES